MAALSALALSPTMSSAVAQRSDLGGLVGTTLLIIRHAEKPPDGGGPGLAPAGDARALAYADYFRRFRIEDIPVHIDALVAATDSPRSARPRLTLEPLSQAIGVSIQQPFPDKDVDGLTRWLASGAPGRTILIAWHHGELPRLLQDLGADPDTLLPGAVWPPTTYDWVIVLRYDQNARLTSAQRITEPTFGP